MDEPKKPSEPDKVACEICFKQIPISEAKSLEASDYVHHFCGLECYARWKGQVKRAP